MKSIELSKAFAYSVVPKTGRLVINKSWKTFVLAGDKDPYNRGLNPRAEVTCLDRFPVNGEYFSEFECNVSNNVTFYQILHRNERGEGKPLFLLDTHNGQVNLRVWNFKTRQLIRQPVVRNTGTIKGALSFRLANDGYVKVTLNDKSLTYSGMLRWQNNNLAWLQFGTYLTNKSVQPFGQTEYTKLWLKNK